MQDSINRAAEIIVSSSKLIALTGAGISVESGIPDFRSAGGLWEKYDPMVYASIHTFMKRPELVWEMIFDMVEIVERARPNPAHKALAWLEQAGYLSCIITQNIDNLHQDAGSKNVIEYHGNSGVLLCSSCGREYRGSDFSREEKKIPLCADCDCILKPGVIFFGEAIPHRALADSEAHALCADAVLVVGTSAVVYPAASIPVIAKRKGARVIEVNIEKTELTGAVSDVFLQGKAGEILPRLADAVKSKGGKLNI